MFTAGNDPVRPVSLGTAMQVTLDNFYALMKTHAGVADNELLQLRLAADLIDISDDNVVASKGGYTWFSYLNLVDRSDRQIQPSPVSPDPGGAQINAIKLSAVYGDFLRVLRGFVVRTELSADDQKKVADFDNLIEQKGDEYGKLLAQDKSKWKTLCNQTGDPVGDINKYMSWSSSFGNLRKMRRVLDDLDTLRFDQKTVLNRKYADPVDEQIVKAENDYYNPNMKASYPEQPDYTFPTGDSFNIQYLIGLGMAGSGAFDYRYVINFDMSLHNIKTTGGGHLDAMWDRTESSSKTMETDWSASAHGQYYFISAKANASEQTKIQDDFTHTTGIHMKAEAVFRIKIRYPQWFHPELFTNKYIKANPKSFEKFFGHSGELLYYPLDLVVVRGFSATFLSNQNWTFDYDHKFSAGGGGGFGIGPISFGASGSYNEHTHEHKVDVQKTELTIGDDPSTLRFIGYVLAKNRVFEEALTEFTSSAQFAP